VVLGFLVESNYRRSLLLSAGDHSIFLEDPIAIGLPALWGQGLGREAVSLLLDFGFGSEGVDVIYALVDPENARSRRMFASLGFAVVASTDCATGSEADAELDLALKRADYDVARLTD
jgi:RimJ/RimL family protein N-acetyltransferase